MTTAVQSLLESFDLLTDTEKHELTVAILRRSTLSDVPPLPDDALVLSAEALFLELDKEETCHGQP